MKQSSIIILLTVLMSTVSTKAFAHDIAVENADGVTIYYNWVNSNELAVSFKGGSFQSANSYSGVVVIPESVEHEGKTYKVTEIGRAAFYSCQNLTSVTLPQTLTTIGDNAFYYCIKLSSITIPKSVSTVRANAFNACNGLTSVHISDLTAWCKIEWYIDQTEGNNRASNPLSYAHHLFLNGKEIKELIIPDGVTSIAHAFEGCSGLTSVTIPSTVTSIGVESFLFCSGLTSVSIPNSVTTIDARSFYGCSSLTSIKIPNTVTYIREGAFQNCSNLISITIPNSVTYVGKDAFKETAWYNNQNGLVYIGPIAYKYKGTMPENTEIVIREGTTRIGEGAFSGCSGLKSIQIPKSVTNMEEKSFSGCSGLTSVYISDLAAWCNIIFRPHDVGGFDYCSSNPLSFAQHLYLNGKEITDMIIPEGVATIKSWAFYSFSGLTSVRIPNSVTEIGFRAFERCSNIISIDIPSSVTSIGKDAFAGTPWFENYKGLMYLGSMAYKYKGEMPENTEIVIREGTTEISSNAFQDCIGLVSVTIPASVTEIGSGAFFGCSNLTSVHISDLTAWCNAKWNFSPFSTAYHLYLNGDEITNLIIPDGITSIKDGAFDGCCGLKTVTIPNGVTSIGNSVFSGCSDMNSIIIPKSVTKIGASVFSGCSNLTFVTIPKGVSSIDKVFQDCIGLTTVNLSEGLTSIGFQAFMNCSNLKSVILPNSVTSIEHHAFSGCSSLTSIKIPKGVTSIGNNAFQNCTSLTSVEIPNSVISIEGEAFWNCSSLMSLTIPQSVTSIGWHVVEGCAILKYIAFTSDKITDYQGIGNTKGQFIIPQSVYDKGIPNNITKFATYSSIPVYVEVKSIGAVSAILNLYPIDKDGNIDEENMTTVTSVGHKPGEQLGWKLNDENYGILSDKTNETISLAVQEPKALSTIKARLLATTEEADDFAHYGFEWRQQDAPEGRPSNNVSAPLYNGHIVGTLNNLNPDKDYKYRPFYKADDGTMFYGDWMWLYTGDANVTFEPEVYTKDAADITKVSALLAGVWFEGTDNIEEKGFEYWTVSGSKTRVAGNDVKKVAVTSNAMTMTLEGLKSGATYGFRSYAKTASGTTYGEEKTFKTILIGDVDGDGGLTKDDADAIAKHIMGQTPTGFIKKMADMNEDGKINAVDIVMLINIIK